MHVFDGAFADVNEHFSTLVTSLFPGGTGRLFLTDPENLLDTGVEVEVRPAGRNVRRLSLLSGGERSLVALAYLFAVFRSRPSPFYLMDEVEAALDDVNLQRFLGLVHEFRDGAQLIIVSHQKRTMEAADALYGVTMAPGGSSKVISQKVPRHRENGEPMSDPTRWPTHQLPRPTRCSSRHRPRRWPSRPRPSPPIARSEANGSDDTHRWPARRRIDRIRRVARCRADRPDRPRSRTCRWGRPVIDGLAFASSDAVIGLAIAIPGRGGGRRGGGGDAPS